MSKKARKTKKHSKKKRKKKTKKRKTEKKTKKRKKTTFKDDLKEFISLSKKDIEILRIDRDYDKTFRCPQCGRYLAKGTEECPCSAKFIEELYEPKAEITDFFRYLYKPEEVPEIKKKLAPPPPDIKKPKLEKPVEPEPEEPEDLELEGLEELAPEEPEEFEIEELEELVKEAQEEPKKEEMERPPREMISLMDIPEAFDVIVKVGPSREELSLVDEPKMAEAAEKAAEKRFLFRRIRRDRVLFYTGAFMILLGGPIVALSSWYHDWFQVPLVGDNYEAFGWLNEFAVMIGIVILVVGVIFFSVSLRGGAISNKEFKKLKSEG